MARTVAPRYGLMVTRPAPARVFSASRTGVLETPSRCASSASTRLCPGRSSPARIARLIASSTAAVRSGIAPTEPVRNASAVLIRTSYLRSYLIYDLPALTRWPSTEDERGDEQGGHARGAGTEAERGDEQGGHASGAGTEAERGDEQGGHARGAGTEAERGDEQGGHARGAGAEG